MAYERKQGRNPEDDSGKKEGYDVKSSDRLIEVKKRDIKYGFVFITNNEFSTFLKNKNAFLYLVRYKDGKPMLKIFDRDVVLGNSQAELRYRFQMRKLLKESTEIELS